jgi:hypothetical protein
VALTTFAAGTVVRGIGWRRYGTAFAEFAPMRTNGGAARTGAALCRFENCWATENAMAGIFVNSSPLNVVSHVSAWDNGLMGIRGGAAVDIRAEWCDVRRNNHRRFLTFGAAGGMKIDNDSTGTRIVDCYAEANIGTGLWSDQYGGTPTKPLYMCRNRTLNNTEAGVFPEVADTAYIVGNRCEGDAVGIQMGEDRNHHVWHNTIVNCGMGITVYDGSRDTTSVNAIRWDRSDFFALRGNVIVTGAKSTGYQNHVRNQSRAEYFENRYWQQLHWTSNYTALWIHNEAVAGPAYGVHTTGAAGSGVTAYDRMSQMRAALGQEANGVETIAGTNPYINADHTPKAALLAMAAPTITDANVANAIRVPVGGRAVVGAIQPAPTFSGTSAQKINATIDAIVGGGFTTEADILAILAIGVAESSLNPTARNPHPEYPPRPDGSVAVDRGLWQISSHWWPQFTDAQCDNPNTAIDAVRIISENGTTWQPWDTHKTGVAQSHYDGSVNGWPALRPYVRLWTQRV